jgi:transposase-like protein
LSSRSELIQRKPGGVAEPAEIQECLATLARVGGNATKAARITGVPRQTIAKWRDQHEEAYLHLAQRMQDAIEDRVVVGYSELTLRSTEAAILAVDLERQRLEREEVKDAAASAQRLATVAGITTDKRLLLEGRPTSIHAASSVEEDLRFLRSKAIDGEAVEEIDPSLSDPKTIQARDEG